MKTAFVSGQDFAKTDFKILGLPAAEFDSCVFTDCNFAGVDLSAACFFDSRFIRCDFSLAAVGGTVFSGVAFSGCKMLGLKWEDCNKTGLDVSFDTCILDHCSFSGVKMVKTRFSECRLREAAFNDADFREAVFEKCDFDRAVFGNTNLEGANLSTSFNFSIAPDENRLKKAKFSLHGLPGLLGKYKIIVEE